MTPLTIDPFVTQNASELKSSMRTDDVRLPFAAPYIYVRNGEQRLSALEKTNPTLYFGGWEVEASDFLTMAVEHGHTAPPAGWIQYDAKGKSEKFTAYTTRNVIVAPIARRFCWFDDAIRTPDYRKGLRGWAQILCLLGHKAEGSIQPFGPVILSVKGNQSRAITGIISTWEKTTEKARSEVAPNIPAWLFYMAIGTFQAQPIYKEVGERQKSTITPIVLYNPPMTADLISKLYVGNQVAKTMIEYVRLAHDWAKAWETASANCERPITSPVD